MLTKTVPQALQTFFSEHPKVALAFSGGVDSVYLLYAAKACGCDVHAYYVSTAFQPGFELDDAKRVASELQAEMTVLPFDVLAQEVVQVNPKDRCYYCKQALFGLLLKTAHEDGYDVLLDGTNASDDASDRPGMRALREMKVLSPLQSCDITKPQIRALSKEANLFTWDKPAYACLATRIPAGMPIMAQDLQKIERAEAFLHTLGFSDLRVRMTVQGGAKLQLPKAQFEKAIALREKIYDACKADFTEVTLDLNPR